MTAQKITKCSPLCFLRSILGATLYFFGQALRTPDLNINGELWEIKSPLGDGKKTMENNLRSARKQSVNIVIDLYRSDMNYYKAMSRIKSYLGTNNHSIKKLKVITKSKKIIDVL